MAFMANHEIAVFLSPLKLKALGFIASFWSVVKYLMLPVYCKCTFICLTADEELYIFSLNSFG